MITVRCSVILIAGVCAGAKAQDEGQASWLWDVTTQDGDAVVEPGETATVTLSIDMSPDVGEEMVLGFGAAEWDVLGAGNADMGGIVDWSVTDFFITILGESDGVNIFDVGAAQLTADLFIDDDPIEVMTFEWAPDVYSQFNVEYLTSTANPPDAPRTVGIMMGESLFDGEIVTWPIEEAGIVFGVVPAPSCVTLLGVAALVAQGRRRESTDGRGQA